MKRLQHRTVYFRPNLVQRCLQFIPGLLEHHPEGTFHLVGDHSKTHRTSIIGMFVLRPGWKRLKAENTKFSLNDLFGDYDWVYNVKGRDGGKFISNSSALDAYRLAIQYGLSDAVIIGSHVVSNEGVKTRACDGYMWQPYEVCKWPHLNNLDPALESKIAQQREQWQEDKILSSRKFPAQIVVTWTGDKKENAADFLAGRIFHDLLPTGGPMESYIMTSEVGAENIRQRADKFNLKHRLDDMLIVLPPPPSFENVAASPSTLMDLSIVPKMLFDKLDIRIANHDGGQGVLQAFARAGALSQLNLTLCKGSSVAELLRQNSEESIFMNTSTSTDQSEFCEEVDKKFQYFFRNQLLSSSTTQLDACRDDTAFGNNSGYTEGGILNCTSSYERALPSNLPVASVITDVCDDVAIVTLKADFKFDFHV